MLNLKKVIALVCVFALMLTTVAFGATYSDVAEDSAYYEAVETLNKLGIVTGYEDGTYKPEDGVTRAEMAALIARIQGYGDTAKAAANTGFADVPASHWASGYVANAAGMGIINGYGDGNFGPEDPVLYEQAVKMVMATLGYTPFAEKNGGYPTGYLAAAQRYNVSLAVANAAVGQEANRGTVAQLLENALDTPLMIQAGWNTNGEVEYKIAEGELVTEYVNRTVQVPTYAADGVTITGYTTQNIVDTVQTTTGYKTLMSENLGYVKIRGILYANDVTNLYGTKNIDTTEESKVWIDVYDDYGTENKKFANKANDEYLVGDLDVDGLLGRSVIAYTKANAKDDFELLSIAVDTNRNDDLVISLDQYNGIAGNEVSYYKEGANDDTKVDVEAGFDGAYNGIGMTGAAALSVVGTNCLFGGQITFIDNDDDKGYDVALVDLASTGVVKKVTEDGINFYNNVIWGSTATTRSIEIDVEDETKFVEITKDGEVIDFTELEAWDVLSIYAVSETADVIKAEVIGSPVVGVVSSSKNSTSSQGGTAYKIEDTWYDVARGNYGLTNLTVGDGGTFYIDQFGKIAAFDEDAALATGVAGTYGYVLDTASVENDFGGAASYTGKVQILTSEGVEVLTLKKKIEIKDGAGAVLNTIDTTTWANNTADSTLNGIIAGEVIKYTKNSAGELSAITIAVANDEKFATGSLGTGSSKWDAENNMFAAGYVDADAILFIVDTAATPDAAKCKVGTIADLDDDNNYTIVASYADRKAIDNNIVVLDQASFLTSTTSSIAVIKEVGTSANEDGEAIYALSYLIDGETKEADTVALTDVQWANGSAANLSVGDIVKVKVGSNGLISAVKFIANFTGSTVRNYTVAGMGNVVDIAAGLDSTNEKFAGGYVTAYNENSTLATIAKADGTPFGSYKLETDNANIYVIDGTGKEVVIKNGGTFKFFENLYGKDPMTGVAWADATNVDIFDKDDVEIDLNGSSYVAGDETTTVGAAKKFADHVYVRTYMNKVTDVVIVKGANIKVK